MLTHTFTEMVTSLDTPPSLRQVDKGVATAISSAHQLTEVLLVTCSSPVHLIHRRGGGTSTPSILTSRAQTPPSRHLHTPVPTVGAPNDSSEHEMQIRRDRQLRLIYKRVFSGRGLEALAQRIQSHLMDLHLLLRESLLRARPREG